MIHRLQYDWEKRAVQIRTFYLFVVWGRQADVCGNEKAGRRVVEDHGEGSWGSYQVHAMGQ